MPESSAMQIIKTLIVLNFAGERLLLQVFSKGKCISVNNPKKLAVFRMTSYAKIADFGFYHQKIKAGFIRKIKQV